MKTKIRMAALAAAILSLGSCQVMDKKNDPGSDAITNILSRKSVRAYTDCSINKSKVDTLLRAAMAAPTAVNKQPWAFIVVDNPALLDSLSHVHPYAEMIAHAPLAIVVCGNMDKTLRGDNDPYWPLDCSAASQNILLAAEAMDLGAVWTAVYPESDRMEAVSRILGLPSHIRPFNVIPVGRPAKPEAPKDKYLEENIHYNQW